VNCRSSFSPLSLADVLQELSNPPLEPVPTLDELRGLLLIASKVLYIYTPPSISASCSILLKELHPRWADPATKVDIDVKRNISLQIWPEALDQRLY